MTTITPIIQKFLPEHLREIAMQFSIPEGFIEKIPDIVVLILESKSLDKEDEKQSWLNLLPLMNDEQTAKLKDILTREKVKLAEIEQKYAQKKEQMSQKFVQKFEEGAYQDKMQSVRSQEQEHREKEHEEADDLLNQI
jgi:formate dehydrogenase assembly factor FdhD